MHNHQTQWITQWGGICQGRHDSLIPDGYFADAVNYCLNPDGSLGPRPGTEILSKFPDGRKCIKVFFADWDGTPRLFAATTHHIYRYIPDDPSTEPVEPWSSERWTEVWQWTTPCTRASFALINPNTDPHIVIGNGIDAMVVYKESYGLPEVHAITEPNAPRGLPIEFKNYVAVFGIVDHPGRVQFNVVNGIVERDVSEENGSAIINIEADENGNFVLPSNAYSVKSVFGYIDGIINQNTGARLFYELADSQYNINYNSSGYPVSITTDENSTSLTTLRVEYYFTDEDDPWLYGGIPRTLELQGEVTALYSYNGLVIFTDHRTELFSGDPDTPQGQQVLSNTIGCANYDSVVEAEGSIYWIAQQGICRWDGSGSFPAEIISDPSAERISNICEDVRRINWSNREKFSATYDAINRRLYFKFDYKYRDLEDVNMELVNVSDIFDFELKSGSWFRWRFRYEEKNESIRGTEQDKSYDLNIDRMYFVNVPRRTLEGTESVDYLNGRLLLSSPDSKLYLMKFDLYDESFVDGYFMYSGNIEEYHDYEYKIRSGSMDMGTTEYDKMFRAITLKVVPNNKNYTGAKEITFKCFGDCQPTDQLATFRINFVFIVGESCVGDRLTMLYATEQRRPIAMKCKYFSWILSGMGGKNAMPICAIGISYRPYSNRSTLTWDNDLL